MDSASPTDEWGTEALDLDAYLQRIDQDPTEPTAAALHALHQPHVRTIPFDNVDPALGRTPRLDLAALTDKLVHRRRGGYCYEHNLLFAAALERLGYPVRRLAARVAPDHPGPRTHMNLIVHAEGQPYLADVGFGAGILSPMRLRAGEQADQAGWRHRLTRHDDGQWRLNKLEGQSWIAQYAFDETPQLPIDYEVANHYVATHPNSPFTGKLLVMRLDTGICRRFVGRELHTQRPDGTVDRLRITPDRLAATLHDLDITVDPGDLARLKDLVAP
jgi:N-hydroxyarylamine O-acetyltransferase